MEQLDHFLLNVDLLQVLTPEQAWHYKIIPKSFSKQQLAFFVAEENADDMIHQELEMLFGKDVTLEKVPTTKIQKTLGKYYRREQSKAVQVDSKLAAQPEDFLIKLIDEAKKLGSSDIHIETYEDRCRIRIRIDGLLVERYALAKTDYPSIINKIKIKANLDISEKRLPQDGRIFFASEGKKFDIRVSILPTLYGEKVVLRLLGHDATDIDIHSLGFSENDLTNYIEGTKKPNGIVLISGPTGSGKTTTLYATLRLLNKETRNILTIEDPIEYTLEGINQVQVKESIGLTFSSALRTFLRQDPDIIMLGEMRDSETATMAIRAALTGHLVLSTIHTNSAWGTVSRLVDMGVPPFLVASTLNTTVAQRLVRMLCNDCKEKKPFDTVYFPPKFKPFRPIHEHYVAKGCEKCFYTGYKGRTAIYEVIPIDTELADHIKRNDLDISAQLKQKNVKGLAANVFELFEQGKTSIEEIYPILLIN